MNLHALSLVASVLLAPEPPKEGPAKAKDDSYYARVEIRGVLVTVRERWEPITVVITRPKFTKYPMNVSKLKGWTEAQLLRLNGRVVRVTGTLELLPIGTGPSVTEERLVVVATALQTEEELLPEIKGL